MNTKFEIEKSFGKVSIEIVELKAETKIKCQIRGQEEFVAKNLDETKKALVFWKVIEIKIDGKTQKIGGIFLPNFDEVNAAFKAFEKTIEEKAVAEKAQKIADLKSGKTKIKVSYHDGEYLTGHEIMGIEAELLEELKLAKYVNGWGYLVDGELVKALGEEFTYTQAAEFAKPKLNAVAAQKAEKEAALQAKFTEAKQTGKPVEISRWMADCNDPNEECSMDVMNEWAMPDGTVKTTRQHTW